MVVADEPRAGDGAVGADCAGGRVRGSAGEGEPAAARADGLSSGGGAEGSGGGDRRAATTAAAPARRWIRATRAAAADVKLEELCKLISNRNQDDPTANDTHHRFNLRGTDLGIPVAHGNDVFFFFGDSAGAAGIWPLGAAIAARRGRLLRRRRRRARRRSEDAVLEPRASSRCRRRTASARRWMRSGAARLRRRRDDRARRRRARRLHPQSRRRSRQEPVPAAARRLRGADGRLLLRRRDLRLLLDACRSRRSR